MAEKEYRVISPGINSAPESNPKVIGHRFKEAIRLRRPGEFAELQEREVGEWKTVERSEEKSK